MPGPAVIALAGYQIISGIQQGETVRAQAQLNQQIDEMNAQYAELDAYRAEQSGLSQAARYENVINAISAKQKVAFASQDVDINFGTAKAVREESKLNGFLNQLDIKNHAHQVALGYKNQAAGLRLQGVMGIAQANYNASAMQNAAILGGAKTIVGNLSGYAEKPTPRTEFVGSGNNQGFYGDHYLSGNTDDGARYLGSDHYNF